jgi:hypothetical protein
MGGGGKASHNCQVALPQVELRGSAAFSQESSARQIALGSPTYTVAEPQELIMGDDDPRGQKYPAAHGPEHTDTLSWDVLP